MYHLWHEAIFETGLSIEQAEAWCNLPWPAKLAERYREKFRSVGWEFGQALINIGRCPCCPKGAQPSPDRVHIKASLEELLRHDEDALAAAFEDYGL